MNNLLLLSTLIITLMISSISARRVKREAIHWNGNNWAFGCDFRGGDFKNVKMRGEDCGGTCAQDSRCSHFTWTRWNGGTCWLKEGTISPSDAFSTTDRTMVCGGPGFEGKTGKSGNENTCGNGGVFINSKISCVIAGERK